MPVNPSTSPFPNDWIKEAERCVARATELLALGDPVLCETQLEEAATSFRRSAFSASEDMNRGLDAEAQARLQILRKRILILQAAARHAIALRSGLDQLDPASVVGYNRGGLELAL